MSSTLKTKEMDMLNGSMIKNIFIFYKRTIKELETQNVLAERMD